MSLSEEVVTTLINKNLTISICESVTGGMIASSLVDIPNASKTFIASIITYTNKSKSMLLGVKKETLEKYGAISKEIANEMVNGLIKKTNSDIGISITGNAGPKPNENKPIGLAYLGICVIDKIYVYEIHSDKIDRNDIRIDFVYQALSYLQKHLSKR
ncbi:MAG: CinA family protein [Mycoplasmataceae bacterium]|jgi:nicotinamide-nucleotide amidase|nr:CinA family protein [Mycoplasmataceae bacterium]